MTADGTKTGNFVRLLTQADAPVYEVFLQEAFRSAIGFEAQANTFKWTEIEDAYPVLGLFVNHELKAMMRIEWISSDKEFLIKSGEDEMPFPLNYPIGYIAKAATAEEFRKKSLNTILRYHALKIFSYWKTSSVLGIMVEGSPRLRTMREMGYYFFNKKRKWTGNFKSNRTVLMAILDGQEKLQSALAQIEATLGPSIAEFPIQFVYQDVKMIEPSRIKFPWHIRSA